MTSNHTSIMSQNGGSVWVADSLSNSRLFSSRLTYNKGSALLHTLRYTINNDSAFFRAFRKYQVRFADSTALGTDVKAILEEESGMDLTNIFEQWYYGEGYPTYTARWNTVGGDLHVKITHTVTMPGITSKFTNPLDIKFRRTGLADTTIRFQIGGNTSNQIVAGLGNVISILAIDPNNYIINKSGSMAKDPTLVVVGVNELQAENEVQIYPNPIENAFRIVTPKPGNYQLKIMNTKGQLLREMPFYSELKVESLDLPSGLYLFQIQSEDGQLKTRRLIRK